MLEILLFFSIMYVGSGCFYAFLWWLDEGLYLGLTKTAAILMSLGIIFMWPLKVFQ